MFSESGSGMLAVPDERSARKSGERSGPGSGDVNARDETTEGRRAIASLIAASELALLAWRGLSTRNSRHSWPIWKRST